MGCCRGCAQERTCPVFIYAVYFIIAAAVCGIFVPAEPDACIDAFFFVEYSIVNLEAGNSLRGFWSILWQNGNLSEVEFITGNILCGLQLIGNRSNGFSGCIFYIKGSFCPVSPDFFIGGKSFRGSVRIA